jgi:predicted AlkP superfamily phosphohydrolase/phosphomutase
MSSPVLAIALDAADIGLVRAWVEQGLLPNLKRLFAGGSAFTLGNHPLYRNETPWVSLLSGCSPDQTGYWTPLRLRAGSYRVYDGGGYSFAPHRPFHALAADRRAVVFDLPHCGRLFPEVAGVQVLGWGAHSPMGGGQSEPAGLFRELQRRFGSHPAARLQNGGAWWDGDRLQRLHSALITGLRRRGAIMRALLAEHPADLWLMAFSELHVAGHHFWHLSDPGHPAFGRNAPPLPDLLLDVYRETDRELGRVLERMPGDARLLVFSPEGGAANWCDLNSLLFLPELLFRWSFPGHSLLDGAGPAGPAVIPAGSDWVEAVWRDHFSDLPPAWVPGPLQPPFRWLAGLPGCHFPFYVLRRLGALQWQPPVWYRPWWPRMKAFALPSYGDGCIRFNLKGREPQGIVEPAEYGALCRELSERLLRLRDPRSGRPLVREVVRVAEFLASGREDLRPDADLVVRWQGDANDMAEAEGAQRLGPAPFWKTGSHRPTGFVLGVGPGIAAGADAGEARVIDLAPTVLALLGVPRPAAMGGSPLFGQGG